MGFAASKKPSMRLAAGADIVKFRHLKPKIQSQSAPLAEYQMKMRMLKPMEMVSSLELSESDHSTLNEFALQNGIGIFSTASI